MTNAHPTQSDSTPRERRHSRRVSSMKSDSDSGQQRNRKLAGQTSKNTPDKLERSGRSCLTRQVSNDGLSNMREDKKQSASGMVAEKSTPLRKTETCRAAKLSVKSKKQDGVGSVNSTPRFPNPLHNPGIFDQHQKAIRLEAELHPMRLVLARLMAHLPHNRRGIFNVPVDPVALGLSDYFDVIKKPMDLGTVKNRLHAVKYKSRAEAAADIRLCFHNAMTYNPPNNSVYHAADALLDFFEDQLDSFCPELSQKGRRKFSLVPSGKGKISFHEPIDRPDGTFLQDVGTAVSSPSTTALEDAASALPATPTAAVHTQSTRKHNSETLLAPSVSSMTARKRKKRGAKTNTKHNCQWCEGRTCSLCLQGCLQLEPSFLSCSGPHCAGAKIRKSAVYHVSVDGSSQYCQRCYAGLPAVLPHSGKPNDSGCRYKRDLLKRKNDEEVVESWLTCSACQTSVHSTCVMHDPFAHSSENYLCPSCAPVPKSNPTSPREVMMVGEEPLVYTFVAGSDLPVPMSRISKGSFRSGEHVLSADALPESSLSAFIEQKVREKMISRDYPDAEKTVSVRVISDCRRSFKVPDVVRKHFHVQSSSGSSVAPPKLVHYRSKAIALFQKIDGLDVCIFCMYVQEYNGDDEYEKLQDKLNATQQKRVYIAYLDSVEHFRPRTLRTKVYHEVLTAYLATAKMRGFEMANIWACPPSRGNSFVFWNHPDAQKTPNVERLTAWYRTALSRAINCGVVTDVRSMYEDSFELSMERLVQSEVDEDFPETLACPPLLDGDFWIEEAVRFHSITHARHAKEKSIPDEDAPFVRDRSGMLSPCPAVQVATMLCDKLIMHPSSTAFHRPVNAAALKLKDYHKIVKVPMDLGTIHTRCALGEYRTLRDMVDDMRLMFANAKKFNPKGHLVHQKALEVELIFFTELNNLTKKWSPPDVVESEQSWRVHADVEMSLNTNLKHGFELSRVSRQSKNANSSVCMPSVPVERSSASMPSSSRRNNEISDRPFPDQLSGSDAIHRRMVGTDIWMLNKKAPAQKASQPKNKRKNLSGETIDEPISKRRKQCWLGESVAASVRKMRTSFFSCSLLPDFSPTDQSTTQLLKFEEYVEGFNLEESLPRHDSLVADARHALLEFSQFRNLEFDTLRRAKNSSAVLLYHLHNNNAPGVIPSCTTCKHEIDGVRFHRITKVFERRTVGVASGFGRTPCSTPRVFVPQELCAACYEGHAEQHEYVPLPVSFQ